MEKNIIVPINLLTAINHLCTYAESKVLLATIYCGADAPTSVQMGNITGIKPSNNYFRTRKQLLDLGYLVIGPDGMHVNADKILEDYTKLTS